MKALFFLFLLLALPLPVLAKEVTNLPVPFIPETPDKKWVNPWKNACEEASVVMIQEFYLGTKNVSRPRAKELMIPLFAWENKTFGNNLNSSAEETARIVNEITTYDAKVKKNPTLEEIKNELAEGRPIISFHHGKGLKNPRIPFLQSGSYYHVFVIKGFDDITKEFIVNEVALDPDGLDFRYSYATILNTLGDYNQKTRKVDLVPTVLFTKPKELVRAEGTKRVYLVRDGKRYLILTPKVMSSRRLQRLSIKTLSKTELNTLPYGGAIEK